MCLLNLCCQCLLKVVCTVTNTFFRTNYCICAGTGLFGAQQNATTSTGIFGSTTGSAFGQAKPFGFATQTQSTGLFGQQPQPAQAQPTSLFGQPAAQTTPGLFGSPTGICCYYFYNCYSH